jgi:hypothetical protein
VVYALLCPKCKSYLPLPQKRPKAFTTLNVFCKICNNNVDAFIVQVDENAKDFNSKDAEPTEFDKNVVNSLSSLPILSAFYCVGNTSAVVKFIIVRILLFLPFLFLTENPIQIHLTNPYSLIIGSSAALVIFHVLYVVKLPSDLRMIRIPALWLLGILPLVLFELLLIASNLTYFIFDATIVFISIMLLNSKEIKV